MTAKIIDGRLVANKIRILLEETINKLNRKGTSPCLATVLVGKDDASTIYVNSKQKAALDLGIKTKDFRLDLNTSENELCDLVSSLNEDRNIHGILVQMPLPPHIDESSVINKINQAKDVDGLTPSNAGLLVNGLDSLVPCTPLGILELLKFYQIGVESMNTAIVNRSKLVGIPLAHLMLQKNATVTICHSKTKQLENLLSEADLIVTAVGNASMFRLTSNMVKEGTIVIDVGNNRLNGKVTGDVDFESVRHKASWITPVPGGVGPMTITMLLSNTVKAASQLNA
ncbi:MAG TPA: tetrahydrofolate dehydrogenase/cyclohydrolase catalytic domain-containing protein [Nitrososphaeraceae archaeon]|jgi:methylenetetrahydrofolate dehydrogenase (NADP+)/methenyltetrahydrofolate cyclohydrolase